VRSKNKPKPTAAEARHIARVAALNCSVCNVASPVEVHEIKQGQWFTSVALCADCHRGDFNGWHGMKRMWSVRKMDELDALAVTLARLYG